MHGKVCLVLALLMSSSMLVCACYGYYRVQREVEGRVNRASAYALVELEKIGKDVLDGSNEFMAFFMEEYLLSAEESHIKIRLLEKEQGKGMVLEVSEYVNYWPCFGKYYTVKLSLSDMGASSMCFS